MTDIISKIRGKKTHNMTNTLIFYTWANMIQRCTNKNHKAYHAYGGRGIKVCDEWLISFGQFYKDVGDKPKGMTLDRINNDGDYKPGNTRWVTMKEQSNNTRRSKWIEHSGRRMTLSQWAEHLGISRSTLGHRLTTMPLDKALTKGNMR